MFPGRNCLLWCRVNHSNYTLQGSFQGRSLTPEQEGKVEYVQGFNNGLEEATKKFNEIILILFAAQFMQLLALTVMNHNGEFFGRQIVPEDKVHWFKILNGNLVSLGFALTAYLVVVQFFPAIGVQT